MNKKNEDSMVKEILKDNEDYMIRATALDGAVSAIAIRHTNACRDMTEIHSLSPIVAAAFGRLCGGVMMMSQDLKSDDATVSTTISCDGPIGEMFAISSSDGMVRGYVKNPTVETVYKNEGKLDVGAAVGKGSLTVIKDMKMKEPYIGRVELISGEIAEDLAAYYLFSEQIPTVVSLGVKMDREGITHAGGLMIRLLPDASEDVISYIEKRALGFPEISWLLEEGFDPHQVIDLFLGDPEIKYYEKIPCGYRCNCSEEKMERNLITLGAEELKELSDDINGIELECHFCNSKYQFSQEKILSLIENIKK